MPTMRDTRAAQLEAQLCRHGELHQLHFQDGNTMQSAFSTHAVRHGDPGIGRHVEHLTVTFVTPQPIETANRKNVIVRSSGSRCSSSRNGVSDDSRGRK